MRSKPIQHSDWYVSPFSEKQHTLVNFSHAHFVVVLFFSFFSSFFFLFFFFWGGGGVLWNFVSIAERTLDIRTVKVVCSAETLCW